MRGIAFAPKRDSDGLKDAREFQNEARAFAAGRDCRVCVFDNGAPMPARLAEVKQFLANEQSLDYVAFFCHGWADGIQAGLRRKDVREFAAWLKARIVPKKFRVLLYCCSTAEDGIKSTDDLAPGTGGEGGFADKLADELWFLGVDVEVYGHVTAGHTTRNPYVRRFTGSGNHAKGGEWLVQPKTPYWSKWVKLLTTKYRFDYPFESQAQIESRLRQQIP